MATSLRIPVLAIPVLCVLAVCDAGMDDAAPTRGQAGGVEVVRHGKLADYARPVFAVEHLLAIGVEDGPPEFSFGEVPGLDVMADGTIAILDGQAGEVRTFAPDGSFLRRIGRKGEGPGEISGEAALALVAVSPTSFLVPDIMTQTLNVYSLGSDSVVSRRFDIQEMYIPEWRTTGDALPIVRVSTPGGEMVARYSVFSVAESLRDTLAVVARPAEPEAASRRQPLWQDHLVWSFSEPNVVVAGWMFAPEFTVHSDGHPVRTVAWDHEDAVLGREQQDAILKIVVRGMGMDDAQVPEGFRDQFRVPDRLPAMADIEVGDDLVLVQRVRPVETMDRRVIYTFKAAGFGGRRWDAFSFEGEYLGVLDLGAPADVYDIRGDTIIGVREDDAGIRQVFLARLPNGLRRNATSAQSPR